MPNVDRTMNSFHTTTSAAHLFCVKSLAARSFAVLSRARKCAVFAVLSAAGIAFAAPGDLDTSFSGGIGSPAGTIIEGRSAVYTHATTKLQADGKITSVGTILFSGMSDLRFAVMRHLSDGTLDPSFGLNGYTAPALTSFNVDRGRDLAIQADGKIILAGQCQVNLPGPPQPTASDDFCLIRLEANGQPDLSFGVSGVVVTPIGPKDDQLASIALQADGRIVAAGTCASSADNALSVGQACLTRYLVDGTLDATFGTGGKVVQSISATETINAIAIQENGRILIAGLCVDGSAPVGCVARFTSSGALDSSFSSNGIRYVTFPALTLNAQFVAIQPDGKIMVGGRCTAAGVGDFCLARLNANGTLASTLSSNGRLVAPIGSGQDYARAIAIQPDGKLIVSGYCSYNARLAFCTARFFDDGAFDTGFGVNGIVITEVQSTAGTDDLGRSVSLQRDGKIVVSGTCADPTNPTLPRNRLCLARYLGGPETAKNCSLDIDGDGTVLATTDMLILNRAAAGVPRSALLNGIALAANALRTNTTQIRDYLVGHCGMSIVP
jgi:uncharacterized delta-60 repeat protein